eukprot:3643577-Pleurochrysis_carterae.AAC.2
MGGEGTRRRERAAAELRRPCGSEAEAAAPAGSTDRNGPLDRLSTPSVVHDLYFVVTSTQKGTGPHAIGAQADGTPGRAGRAGVDTRRGQAPAGRAAAGTIRPGGRTAGAGREAARLRRALPTHVARSRGGGRRREERREG